MVIFIPDSMDNNSNQLIPGISLSPFVFIFPLIQTNKGEKAIDIKNPDNKRNFCPLTGKFKVLLNHMASIMLKKNWIMKTRKNTVRDNLIPYHAEFRTKMYNIRTCKKQTINNIVAESVSGASGVFNPEGIIDSLSVMLMIQIMYNAIVPTITRQV
jgi:hypothetical protein